MFESLDNTPTLKSQPTSLIFSLDADGKDIRALIGDGFIFLCCEDLDEDLHKFSQYFTGELPTGFSPWASSASTSPLKNSVMCSKLAIPHVP